MSPSKRSSSPRVKIQYSFKKIMMGSDLSTRRLPIMTATSPHPGPLVWITACSHGDEVSGIVVVQEVFRILKSSLLNGSVKAFPLMNPIGFEARQRYLGMSREDLNRSYPGSPSGSLGERMAHLIFGELTSTKPDLVMDLHNDWIESIPYVLLDHAPGPSGAAAYAQSIKLGQQAGLCTIVDNDELTSSLSFNLLQNGIPALTFELGKAHVVSEMNVMYGVEAIWNILSHLGMLESREKKFQYPLPKEFGSGTMLKYSDRPYGSSVGIIRFMAKPGQIVEKGQPLAKIVNTFGKHRETLRANEKAIVLGHSDSSAAFPGMPIMAFGKLDDSLSNTN